MCGRCVRLRLKRECFDVGLGHKERCYDIGFHYICANIRHGRSSCPSSTPPLSLSHAVHLRMGFTSVPPYCFNLIVIYEYTYEQASLRSPVGRLL